jgi:hypothetical protein
MSIACVPEIVASFNSKMSEQLKPNRAYFIWQIQLDKDQNRPKNVPSKSTNRK